MLPTPKLIKALAKVPLVSAHGPWTRSIGFQHLIGAEPQPLWGGASRINGARFTPRGSFDSIYLANDPITALTEVWALIMLPNAPLPVLSNPLVIISLDGILHNLLDLNDQGTLASLNTTLQEVTGPWATALQPPTQLLGQAAYDSGRITGIKYGSAKNPRGLNLVVFPDRIAISPGIFLEVHDPQGYLKQRIGSTS
jgi:RES domain-containing protein